VGCDQCLGIRKVFGKRIARFDLRRYRSRGPARTTRLLLDALTREGIAGSSVLDIGGGVGAIPNHLLIGGSQRAVLVEASPAYIEAARAEAEHQGHSDRMTFREGDFIRLADEIEPATVVTLDRVICCYDDLPALVLASAGHAQSLYGLVYPRDTWWNRAGASLVNLVVRLPGIPYRLFVHRQSEVEKLVEGAGFTRASGRDLGLWQVVVYRRAKRPPSETAR
jgi:hypothetical protein